MPSITLTVSNAVATRLTNAIGYSATVNGVPNPVTAVQAIKERLADDIKKIIRDYESNLAAQQAITNTNTDVDTTISVT